MANQRKRLGQFYGRKPLSYVATFDHISHKMNSQGGQAPVVLIKDIVLVDPFRRFIQPTGFHDFELCKQPYVVADHTWVNFTKQWFTLEQEALPGDRVYFTAQVERYPINRDDVLKQRDKIWNNAKEANDQLYQQWRSRSKANPGINFSVSYKDMKAEQQENLDNAREEQRNISLVDFSFSRMRDLRLTKLNPATKNIKRIKYDYDEYERLGYKYTFWLATRSMKVAKWLKAKESR